MSVSRGKPSSPFSTLTYRLGVRWGRLYLTVLGMVAQMERRFIKERQRDGIEKAKAEGTCHGGKRRLDHDKILSLHRQGRGPAAIARTIGCSRMRVYRVLSLLLQTAA
jgi:DNA invertase Pin-like site-specific DNA recombinase